MAYLITSLFSLSCLFPFLSLLSLSSGLRFRLTLFRAWRGPGMAWRVAGWWAGWWAGGLGSSQAIPSLERVKKRISRMPKKSMQAGRQAAFCRSIQAVRGLMAAQPLRTNASPPSACNIPTLAETWQERVRKLAVTSKRTLNAPETHQKLYRLLKHRGKRHAGHYSPVSSQAGKPRLPAQPQKPKPDTEICTQHPCTVAALA